MSMMIAETEHFASVRLDYTIFPRFLQQLHLFKPDKSVHFMQCSTKITQISPILCIKFKCCHDLNFFICCQINLCYFTRFKYLYIERNLCSNSLFWCSNSLSYVSVALAWNTNHFGKGNIKGSFYNQGANFQFN